MDLPSYFNDFLRDIRLTLPQVDDCKRGHKTLRRRLLEDEKLSRIIVNTFLQGSYRRATAVRPRGNSRADVDVIVVTKLHRDEFTPQKALDEFKPFLEEHYKGKYEPQGRSFAIELSYVDLDLVPTAAPSESQYGVLTEEDVFGDEAIEEVSDQRSAKGLLSYGEKQAYHLSSLIDEETRNDPKWKLEPLYIPDRDVAEWTRTHPLEQIRWTVTKNSECNGHYVNVVKAIKWWRRLNPIPKYPKGYPVEHLLGQHCPSGVKSVAQGVTMALESIVRSYANYNALNLKPSFSDHGVPEHDVFKRVSSEDFAAFYALVVDAAKLAREALDADTVKSSALKWRALFGDKFPPPPDSDDGEDNGGGDPADRSSGGFSPRTAPSIITGGRYG